MPKFIEAVAKATGRKQRIPAAWLDHPVLSEGFRKTSRASAQEAAATSRPAKKATAKKAAATNDAPPAGDKE